MESANAFIERSHRTDDEGFYAIDLSKSTSPASFMQMAQDWICFYNYARPHFGVDMTTGRTPIKAVKRYHVLCHPTIASMPIVMLERTTLHINHLFDLT